MKIEEALEFGRCQLAGSRDRPADAVLDSRLVLAHVLGVCHSYLVTHDDETLLQDQERKYRDLIQRASRGEPIPYLTGVVTFYGLDFAVTPAVLIPRPETEHLVDLGLRWAEAKVPARGQSLSQLHLVDVGTGSGCIAIALAVYIPGVVLEATEVSVAAIDVARANSQTHQVAERIQFHQGSLLSPITVAPDLIMANLPYVTDQEWTTLPVGIKSFEPAVALKGGPDGLAVIRRLLQQARSKLAPGGAIFLEIGWRQGPDALRLARSYFPTARVRLVRDRGDRDRIVSVETS